MPADRSGNHPADALVVADLVSRARMGEQQAWDALVERYATLIWSVCRRYRLADADAEDVAQVVWLHLVDHLDKLRDPMALPGWLLTTTRRECAKALRRTYAVTAAGDAVNIDGIPGEQDTVEEELLAAERCAALQTALTDMPAAWRRLMVLLTTDPPLPYREIAARLGIAVGSIGPTRARCLEWLRHHPAIAALGEAA
jgi:RNA polymerase sigma factor (sigma-70 family)